MTDQAPHSRNIPTPEELEQLTGTDVPSKQIKFFEKNNIFIMKGPKGHYSVTWYAINNPMNQKAANDDEEPNFGAMHNG